MAFRWLQDAYQPPAARSEAADEAIAALEDRGSPAHDGLAARLAGYDAADGKLELELQPTRWSLRLVRDDACASLAALCITRDTAGRWLAGGPAPGGAAGAGRGGRRARGGGGGGEDPVQTLGRELEEEWSVQPERLSVEALISLPNRLAMLVGQAWLPEGAEVAPDAEHDEHAWWPADPADWPDHADPQLRRMASILA